MTLILHYYSKRSDTSANIFSKTAIIRIMGKDEIITSTFERIESQQYLRFIQRVAYFSIIPQ